MKATERPCSLHIGANVLPHWGAHFRVWEPRRHTVEVVIEGGDERGSNNRTFELAPEGQGYFSGVIRSVGDGALYRFRLDGGERLYPDPASRYQPGRPARPVAGRRSEEVRMDRSRLARRESARPGHL